MDNPLFLPIFPNQPTAAMPHSFGYRAHTRHLFARDFGKHGNIALSTYLHTYKVGDLVDIKGNGAVQKGLPHKFYHGKTGVVWNVTPRAIGIQVNKLHRNRIIRKKIHVRIEHVKKSTCRDDFLNRVRKNEQIKKDARATGKRTEIKRLPVQPRGTQHVKGTNVQDLFPLAYAGLNV